MEIVEITFEQFETLMLDSYNELFPKDERKDLKTLKRCYDLGVEKLFAILVDKKPVGFFVAEKLGDNYPYYGDYFAIFKEYQSCGYGSKAFKLFLDEVVKDGAMIGEIEPVGKGLNEKDNNTRLRRYNFYKQFGIKCAGYEYELFNVLYTPVYFSKTDIDDETLDKYFMDYYVFNVNNKKKFDENVKKINR